MSGAFLVFLYAMERHNSYHCLLRVRISMVYVTPVGRDNSVDITTRYGLDGSEIETRGSKIFRTSP